MPAWSDAAGQDESHRAEPPKNRSTKTAYQKLVRSPSATPLASSDPIIPFSLPQGIGNLRFHPRCYYRPEADAPTEIWPAMIAAVTDLQGLMAEDEETATARYIASNVSTQLMLKTPFEVIATMADDPDSYRSGMRKKLLELADTIPLSPMAANHPSLWWFFNKVKRLWLASLKRRSQTARLSWERFIQFVARFFPPIGTIHPLPCHRFDAKTRGRSPVR